MALGIQRNTAEAALKKAKNQSDDTTLESLIKKSLQFI
jgi:Holliday junction resolvasome RuvABC DNA-binding subunit